MTGDLTKWSTPDIPQQDGDQVKFKRKGGWFVTTKALVITIILVLILFIAAIIITKQLTESLYEPKSEDVNGSEHSPIIRLTEDIQPFHFELKLEPYLDITPDGIEPFILLGQVVAHLKVLKPTSTVTFNYAGENVTFLHALGSNNRSLKVKSDKYVRNLQLYSIEFEENLQPARNYTVELKFNTSISDEQKGFYRTRHISALTTNKRWMGVSRLEPAYARRLFPCFDEPKFRSTFDISVHRLKNMSALANTKQTTTLPDEQNNAWIWDVFERTPPIPTHKLGVLIADLTVSKVEVANTTVSIWTRQDLFNFSLNLLDITTSLLKFYQSYFTSVQPISKLDLVAIPGYLNDKSGAWGLLIFSESLIFDNKNDKDAEVKFALEISKKLAEQWFGNLVSFDWWNDLWIEDSVSTYLAYHALNKVRPDYEIMSSFMVDVFQKALDTESYPISEEIHILSDITDVWLNDYPALKGACLLHMISSISSTEHIQESINNFLGQWSKKATYSLAFWESFANNFEKHRNIDIVEFVTNWLKHGYPSVKSDYNVLNGEVVLNQKPFYLQYPPLHSSGWDIPIKYTTSQRFLSNVSPNELWLKRNETVLKYIISTNDSWIFINLPFEHVPGFYRVNYDSNNWRSLIKELISLNNSLDEELQAILLDDSYQLAKAGRLPYSIPFNLTTKTLKDTTQLPLRTIDAHLKFLSLFFQGRRDVALFKNFIQDLFSPLLKNITTTSNSNDSFTRNITRAVVLKWSCRYDIPECITWANSTFKSWINNEQTVMDSLQSDIIISTGIRYGSKEDLHTVLNRSLSDNILPKTRLQLLKCLTSSANSRMTLQLLEGALYQRHNQGNHEFNDEDVAVMWKSVSDNIDAQEDLLRFCKEHWYPIYEKYHTNHRILATIIKGVTDDLTEERQLSKLQDINERILKETKVQLKSMKTAINRLIVKTAWRSNKFGVVKDILKSK